MYQKVIVSWVFCFFMITNLFGQSQYFGQNKQRNKTNNFKILQSPHFDLYNYLENKNTTESLLLNAEHWYKQHQEVFKLAFIEPNPLIIYNTHPDFQETTAIGGEIGEGTGGVTEGLRTRVVMPLMFTKRQTDHVLGHELVHAFQYQTMTHGSDSTTLANIQNLPLFMVEGLAEYMSIGRVDTHTSMWLRDAVYNNDIPSIRDLSTKEYKYFPYRWGQAFWAYATAIYGDEIIRPLFKETAIYGLEQAFVRVFKMSTESFSIKFRNDMIQYYLAYKPGKDLEIKGKIVASEKNSSEMNIAPAMSPDGKLVAYISSKNVLSLDIYIAETETGKIIKKIKSDSFGAHVDAYSFIETSGTWSPDNRKLAIVIQSKAINKLMIIDVLNNNKKTYELKNVPAFTNPAWSPDGNSIVVSGLNQGNSDLYLLNLKSNETKKLTDDEFSDFQPTWSADGNWIYFVSDRNSDKVRLEKANFSISRINTQTNFIESFDFLKSADNMNPGVGNNENEFYFLSDKDGFRNIFKYNIIDKQLTQISNYFTGVSGITMYSPAISVASKTGEIVYNYFLKGDYIIAKATEADFIKAKIEDKVNKAAAILPPGNNNSGSEIVQRNIEKQTIGSKISVDTYKNLKYSPKFKLDYLANSGLGVSSSRFGNGVGGGIMALFSDMLNNNQLMGTLALNGEIQDFGGQVYYLNQKRPLQFGVSLSHLPYRFQGQTGFTIDDTSKFRSQSGLKYFKGEIKQRINRLFIDELSFFLFKPINKYKRFELGTSANWYSFSVKEYPQQGEVGIANNGQVYDFISYTSTKAKKLKAANFGYSGFNLAQIYAAYVGDNTTFGTVAPLNGYRYRFELAQFFGSTSYTSVLADYRKYIYLKPFTLATRFMYNGRLNATNLDLLNNINPLYLGFPWNMHGFWGKAFDQQQGLILQENLQGEQMALANFEVRLPFSGPEKLALINFNYLPSDLNFFIDMGVISSQKNRIGTTSDFSNVGDNPLRFKNTPIVTTGLSLRVNVLGYLIIEPYFAVPFYNNKKQPVVSGFNFMVAGW
jgi:Tol biopolymer transport system component